MAPISNYMQSFCVLVVLFILQVVLGVADTHSTVRYLPGFEGTLPFELETGYIGVDKAEAVQLFYYFVKSEKNPQTDPLLLWLNGGPGCSALTGLLYEIGPIRFKLQEYNGTLPTVILNPLSWTQVANIIFVDMPVGTGYSYAKIQTASHSSDTIQIRQADQFLRKWLRQHPEFLSNPTYIAGDSYTGITLPGMVQRMSEGNEEGRKPVINLQGYILGNPVTDTSFDTNSQVPFAHGKAIISYELYESLKTSCGEDYVNIDPNNTECLKYMQEYEKCRFGLNTGQILEPICAFASPKPFQLFGKRRSLNENLQNLAKIDPPVPSIGCRNYNYTFAYTWANDNNVRQALHVQEGSTEQWLRCNYGLPYTHDVPSSIKYHAYLSKKGYRSLIYSGDHDMIVPSLGTLGWIRSLNYSIIDDWRPWMVEGQVGGYTRTYSNNMTFATVKGGGHTAPEYRPTECLAMFERWLNQKPL